MARGHLTLPQQPLCNGLTHPADESMLARDILRDMLEALCLHCSQCCA